MKLNHIYKSIACGVLLAMTATSCDLDYNPVDTYSDVTEGVNKTDEKPIFNSVQDVETSMVTLHKKFRDRQEHWYVDKLLIGDAHSDNAYAGTTGAEVVPYETNSIEGSNSVLKRDWDRFLGDIAVANRIIVGCDQLKALSESERGKYQSQAKIFRAMVMFDMVRLWGNFPVITTVGGDITEDNVEEMYPTYFPPQNTAEEAYAQIEKDLTEAVENPNTPTNDTSDKSILTKSVHVPCLPRSMQKNLCAIMQRLSNMPMNLLPTASTSWKTSATFGRMIRKKKTAGCAIPRRQFSKPTFLPAPATGVLGCSAVT